MARGRFYVVWKGRKRGIYSSWEECELQVNGFVGAEYKAFDTREEASRAFRGSYESFRGNSSSLGKWRLAASRPELPSLCVDAACSGSPGILEYRGVQTENRKQVFRAGLFADGTNNVGEFLAIIDGLKWLRSAGQRWPIYSDSENAIGWVRARKCRTKLVRTSANRGLFELIARAELHLREAGPAGFDDLRLLKWDTRAWGEIPADFGRK